MQSPAYVHCMLIPLSQHYLLLPNTTIAEVIPMPVLQQDTLEKNDVVLGTYHWRNQPIPVIDLAKHLFPTEKIKDSSQHTAKLCIINAIHPESTVSAYATPCSGVPQLITLNESALSPIPIATANEWLYSQLKIGSKLALIPNLDAIEISLKNHTHPH